jgi:hypothetical protein
MSNIRWRLVMALLSLAATLALTAPAPAAASGLPGRRIAEIWPNGVAAVADVIWPNSSFVDDIIWPNGSTF